MRAALWWVWLLLLAAGLGRAEESCPWLNAATAAGALGGPVTATVTGTSCDFAENAPGTGRLHIEVVVMKNIAKEFPGWLARCKKGSEALNAIGNEAVACDAEPVSRVVGRVRDQAFVIDFKLGGAGPRDAAREKARKIAESVAGNLF